MRSRREAVRYYSDLYLSTFDLLAAERPDIKARPDFEKVVLACVIMQEAERVCESSDHETLQNLSAFASRVA